MPVHIYVQSVDRSKRTYSRVVSSELGGCGVVVVKEISWFGLLCSGLKPSVFKGGRVTGFEKGVYGDSCP